jgi:hypothetical protein
MIHDDSSRNSGPAHKERAMREVPPLSLPVALVSIESDIGIAAEALMNHPG